MSLVIPGDANANANCNSSSEKISSIVPGVQASKIDVSLELEQNIDGLPAGSADLDFTVVHSIPGRLRIKLDVLKREPAKVSSCLMSMCNKPGIIGVKTNYWAGSAVIQYDCKLLDEASVIDAINHLLWADKIIAGLPEKPSAVVKFVQNVLEFVDRAFPAAVQLAVGAAAFFATALGLPSIVSQTLLIASVCPIASRAVRTLTEEKKFGVDALDGIAATVMIINGRVIEAAFMAALISLGEFIREQTARRCEKIVSDLLGLSGRSAWLVKGKRRLRVPVDEVKLADIVVVYPGDMVPVDGLVLSGEASVDQSKMTGESVPVEVEKGSHVMAATVVVEGKIHVLCEAVGSATKAGMVINSMNSAPLHETKIQNYAAHVADKAVVPIFLSAGVCFAMTRNVVRMMSMLIFDFSTGIRIAAPTAVLSSMYRAGRRGILIKSGGALERLAGVNAIVFDKTGTLTSGEPKVSRVVSIDGRMEHEILALAAAVELRLHHPASRAIVKYAHNHNVEIPERGQSTHMRGMGVKASVNDLEVIVGSKRLMDVEGIDTSAAKTTEAHVVRAGESMAYIAVNRKLSGMIVYSDVVRDEAVLAIKQLKRLGVRKMVMATGDSESAAQTVACACGIKDVMARAFPEHKAELVSKLKAQGFTVAVVGDGINDSPALAHADVAVSLHGGTEAARQSADVVLTDDDLRRLPEAIKIARSAMDLVRQNLTLAVVPNSAGLGLAAFGMVGPAGATLLNNGSAIAAALNSLRPLFVNTWSTAEPVDTTP